MASSQFDVLEWLAAGYLLLPLLVFLLGWLRWPFALAMGAALAPALYHAWRGRVRRPAGLSRTEVLALAAVAISWVSMSGLAPGFFLNWDWMTRMSVLRDLVAGDWPAGYRLPGEADLVLRCPLGYYLVPALVGKLTSLAGARLALWCWTALGTALFLALLLSANRARKPAAWCAALLIAIFFSGMDIAGWLIADQSSLEYGKHIEWWAKALAPGNEVQYSAQTTQLFWVPNHALPGWLLAALAWRHRQHGLAIVPAALLLLAVAFWAPLVALGAAPLLLWCAWRGLGWRQLAAHGLRLPVLALLPVGWLVFRYLTMNVPAVGAVHAGDALTHIRAAVVFSALEWGLLALAVLWRGERSPLLALALLELVALPFVHYGPSNDLTMRASIPALALLMMATIDAWQHAQPLRRILLTALLAIGSVTPLMEMQRAFLPGPRYLDEQANFIEINGTMWHYVSAVTRPDMRAMLKPPVPLPPGGKP
jgi:hypothetical protein